MGLSGVPRPEGGRHRFRFSLNGLAIQLAAFALSSTLVALLVVSGSQAAFVEPSEALAEYVPVGAAPTEEPRQPRRSAAPQPAAPAPEVPVGPPPASPSTSVTLPSREPVEAEPVEIELTDSDAGTAMFGVETVLVPGVPTERCIEVTYEGDGGSPVVLYAADARGDLGPFLDLTVQVGPGGGGAFGGCSGFTPTATLYGGTLAEFVTAHHSYATGRTGWTPTRREDSRVFRFALALRDDPASSGRSVTFGFSWENRDD